MMYILLALPVAAAMYATTLGAFVQKDHPEETAAAVTLMAAPGATVAWAVVGYMLLQPVGIQAIWAYVAPFVIAFAAMAYALLHLIRRGIKPFPMILAGVLTISAAYVFSVMLSAVLVYA